MIRHNEVGVVGIDEREGLLAVIANDILQAYIADRDAGIVHDVEHYVAHFKGFEDIARIAAEVLPLADKGEPPDHERSRSSPRPAAGILRRIGRYELIAEIGRGGMGIVYLGCDVLLGRKVVAKTLADRRARDLEGPARLHREAVLGSRLSTIPGICPVLDVVNGENAVWIIMPYIAGRTLESVLDERRRNVEAARIDEFGFEGKMIPGRPPTTTSSAATSDGDRVIKETLRWIEKIARSLHRCHELGIVHRDLKPSNVMIGTDGEPTILDLGLAVDRERQGAIALSRDGDSIGTPGYMAPEQIEGRLEDIDRRTDVFGLGVVLYESLTLQFPFPGRSSGARIKAVLDSEPIPPRRHCAPISRDLESVCLKAIEKKPDRRYASALDFADDLSAVIHGRPTRARPIGPIESFLRFCRVNRREVVFVSVILALTAIVLVLSGDNRELDERNSALEAGIKLQYETDPELIKEFALRFSVLIKDEDLKRPFLEAPTSESSKKLLRTTIERSSELFCTILSPRGKTSNTRPTFRIRMPDNATGERLILHIHRGDDQEFDLPLSRCIRVAEGTFEIDLEVGSTLREGTAYEAVLYEEDSSRLYVVPRSGTISFSIAGREEKSRALARWNTVGIPFIDSYFQAAALADAGLFEDAATTLSSHPAPARGAFVALVDTLRNRIRMGLGEAEDR